MKRIIAVGGLVDCLSCFGRGHHRIGHKKRPFVQDYAGEMVTLDSDDLNFSVTLKHDMLTTAGKIEAGEMYEAARTRPRHRIPRSVRGGKVGLPMSEKLIRIAAAYIADGSDRSARYIKISVSRPEKIAALEELNLHDMLTYRDCDGNEAVGRGTGSHPRESARRRLHQGGREHDGEGVRRPQAVHRHRRSPGRHAEFEGVIRCDYRTSKSATLWRSTRRGVLSTHSWRTRVTAFSRCVRSIGASLAPTVLLQPARS